MDGKNSSKLHKLTGKLVTLLEVFPINVYFKFVTLQFGYFQLNLIIFQQGFFIPRDAMFSVHVTYKWKLACKSYLFQMIYYNRYWN